MAISILIFNEPCNFRLEEAKNYQGDVSILEQLAHLARSNSASPEAVMTTAMDLQGIHNAEDVKWIEDLNVDRRLIPEILSRLVERGSSWMVFVQTLVKYEGDLDRLDVAT